MTSANRMRARAKAHMPMVLLTLLSIVQALALELLWAHVQEAGYLLVWSWLALLGWVQVGATLVGILLIWLVYSGLVMRFRWVPTTSDMVFPFFIGIIEFVMIASLGPDTMGQWCLVLGVIFAVTTWVSQVIMRRAREDAENAQFFGRVAPATLRDYRLQIVVVAVLAVLGIVLWSSGHQGWLALAALVFGTGSLAWQAWMIAHFWRRSMALAD
jgi:hypothetical protein